MIDVRLPLEGHLDLTYRCNNNCLHCWLRIPPAAPERSRELSFDELKHIIDEARGLGTRQWSISGGEPMLRPDFAEIFEYVTAKAISYALNTNGTLITPKLAGLLKRKGQKMVALYGATRETYDRITRNPGGFEQVMQGFRYLKDAGAGFTVQLVPMKANWHEWEDMIKLAKSLSPHWRVGAPWLYLSSCRDPDINTEISRQRLDPRDIVILDQPDISYEESHGCQCGHTGDDERIFAGCIARRKDFHLDPYGGMSFCSFLKAPSMRYDLRGGTVREGWEEFIPSLAERTFSGEEFKTHCGSCGFRGDCRWCAVYGWLEHGRFSAPVEHLCEVAQENRRFKDSWKKYHRRYFRIADITIQVESDLPLDDTTFDDKFVPFRADSPGKDTVTIRHHFTLPVLEGYDLGRELYRKSHLAVFRQRGQAGSYIYLDTTPRSDGRPLSRVATFAADHSRGRIYGDDAAEERWRGGSLRSLTMFPSDEIFIARLLADRQGCCLASAGAIINGAGILFIDHFGAGASAVTDLLADALGKGAARGDLLSGTCNIVRRTGDNWQVYGTWDHGDARRMTADGAPLRAVCFMERADKNSVVTFVDRGEIIRRLLAALIRPLVNADWWEKTFDLLEALVRQLHFYSMRVAGYDDMVSGINNLVQPEGSLASAS